MAKKYPLEAKELSFETVDEKDIHYLITTTRKGIDFSFFQNIVGTNLFTFNEWSNYLHVSERTLQRYRKEKRTFDPIQSERIFEISIFIKRGIEVFGNIEKLHSWLITDNLALGKIKPKELLDNTFGIVLLKDELTRIEHGLLA